MTGFSTPWFLEGILHALQTPSHLMIMLGLALLLGQQNKTHFVRELVLLAVAVLAGMLINHYFPMLLTAMLNIELILLVLALSIGLIIIMKWNLHYFVISFSVLICGLLLGVDSAPTIIPGIRSSSINSWLGGAIFGIVAIIGILSLVGLLFRNLLEGIVLRVLGSWIATSALFVLTLVLTKNA